jgi:Glycosidases
VLTDRFRNGDPSNDQPVQGSETPANFQGGDLNGITQAINEGYFDKLGVKSLWITPWQMQPNKAYDDYITDSFTAHVSGYHGYWPIRAREVEPRFGGAEALREMVQAAHAKGIRIIMDTVLNHVHEDHEYMTSHPDWFRTSAICKEINWSDPIGCMFTSYMPDINWTKPETANQFLSDVEWWVEEFDLDGLRVDAVKHMEDNVMGMLGTRMRNRFETAGTDFFMFGETYDGDVGNLNKYIGNGQLDGQFDFRRYFDGASSAFLNDGQGLSDVNRSTWDSINSFGDAMMVTFIGSHDVARVISRSDPDNVGYTGATWGAEYLPRQSTNQLAYDRVWMAMVHLMTTPGVPLIYYGDEYGEEGGSDPDNRHFMKTEAQLSGQQKNQLERMRRLGQARSTLRGFKGGRFETMWVNQEQWGEGHGNLWAYVRWDPQNDPRHNALVVMNLTENTWTNVELHSRDADSLKLSDLGWTSGTVKDYLSGTEYQIHDSAITVDVPARGAVILGLK